MPYFLIGRTIVALPNRESIQKLELQKAHTDCKFMQIYSNEMHGEHKFTHCWTNITTVLSWIASLAKLKIYGSNKYIEILILCEAGQSKHVSEILRKADSAKQTNELKYVNRLWLEPLDFLLTIEAIFSWCMWTCFWVKFNLLNQRDNQDLRKHKNLVN